MKSVNKNLQQAQPESNSVFSQELCKLFPTPANSDFHAFVVESLDLWAQCPEVRAAVEADLRADALARKHSRERDRQFHFAQTLPLPWAGEAEPVGCSLELSPGRPRMSAELAFLFAMIRGWLGSVCSREAVTFLRESATLEWVLRGRGVNLPGATTILENINVLSEATLGLIHRTQLLRAMGEGLEDFRDLSVDSTSVEASSRWPTDSSSIERLLERAWRLGRSLDRWGLPAFKSGCAERWLKEIAKLDFQISTLKEQPGAKRKRRRLYRDLYLTACKMGEKLLGQQREALKAYSEQAGRLVPSRREACEAALEQIVEDISAMGLVLEKSHARIEKGRKTKASERILSLSDRSAAMIVKGGREPVLGYKAQLARSAGGLVSAVLVEPGNPSDSVMLRPLITRGREQTGVTPQSVSADDGYTSGGNLEELERLGVEQVSFSGAKGKKLLGEERWEDPRYEEHRRMRSAVESLMFVLKHNFEFGRMGRRGIEAVRCEMLEKVLAYNIERIVLLRRRAQAPPGQCAA